MILYRAGYAYQLAEDYAVAVPPALRPASHIATEYISLTTVGLLILLRGYAWDGPSGPAIDTPNFMRGSLVHDALYQLLREGHLAPACREAADMFLRDLCLEDGMWRIRAWWVYRGVRLGGGPSADPDNAKPILEAP